MEKTPLISVILPTYHIPEGYFSQCIDSIRRQSYTNWEAVIIDDGNPVGYAAWLDTFARGGIRVIHQENGGLAAARNRGIREAKGEWIYFCDPDDWMHKDELSVLMEAALVSQADISVCQYTRFYEGDTVSQENDCDLGEYHVLSRGDIDDVMLELVAPQRAAALHRNEWLSTCAVTFAWGHLYKAEHAKEIQYISLYPGEDKLYNLYMLERVDRVVFALSNLHYYRIGTGITGKLNQRAIDNSLRAHGYLFEFIENHTWPSDITKEKHKALMDEVAVVTKCILNETETASDFARRLTEYLSPADYQQVIKDVKNPYYTRNQRLLCYLIRFRLFGVLRSCWRAHR